MFWKKFIKGLSYSLMIGACLILGFLSFSGVYILAPILPLAIVVFFLAVLFEGEIYYQNISKAIKSLLKPKYLESRVAEDCLYEAVLDLQNTEELIKAIDEFKCTLENLEKDEDDVRTAYKKMSKQFAKHQKESKNPKIKKVFQNTDYLNPEELELVINNRKKAPKLTFGKYNDSNTQSDRQTSLAIQKKDNLFSILRVNLQTELNTKPSFIKDYERLSIIAHRYSHLNLNKQGKVEKTNINVGLAILENVFAELLFAAPPKRDAADGLEYKQTEEEKALAAYKDELREYLADRYKDEYTAKLNTKRPFSIFNKVLSAVCGSFMILGTSYLLVEAFTIIPVLSAIPFGILPAVVIPLAVFSGVAYGIITYRALDEMLNNDVITKRWAKIKEEWNQGLTTYTRLKMLGFILLLGLAIVLTVCTGGTWYTVIKHTKPIFSWLRKIPAAVTAIVAGFLAIGALAFNISNSMQTGEEIEEYFEAEVPEDDPYNIDLLVLDESLNVENDINYVERTAIIKQGDRFYLHCRNKDNWERIEVNKTSYITWNILNRINFENSVLYSSNKNLLIYNIIRLKAAHKFTPSKENWWQYFNPFRMLIYVVYLPLKCLFFLGHLVSISATADRIPGIPEIVSMFVGFIAEFFEDMHYFAGMEHPEKHDVASIVEERLKGEGEHDHDNDLPSRILRDYLFVPLFWLAAHYHSWASDRVDIPEPPQEKPNEPQEEHILNMLILKPIQYLRNRFSHNRTETNTQQPAINFEDAYQKMKFKSPKATPEFSDKDDLGLVRGDANSINQFVKSEMQTHKKKVLDKEDLVDVKATNDEFIKILLSRPRTSSSGIFAHSGGCCVPQEREVARNRVLPVH